MDFERQSVNTNFLMENFKEIRKVTLIEIMKTLSREGLSLKKNRNLTGKVDIILAAWQMRITSFFTVEKAYLPNFQRDQFIRKLIKKVSEQDNSLMFSEGDIEKSPVMPFLKRYDDDDKYLLANDLIQYFLKGKNAKANELIIPILNVFDMATQGTIANCFNDRETAKKIEYCLLTNKY